MTRQVSSLQLDQICKLILLALVVTTHFRLPSAQATLPLALLSPSGLLLCCVSYSPAQQRFLIHNNAQANYVMLLFLEPAQKR